MTRKPLRKKLDLPAPCASTDPVNIVTPPEHEKANHNPVITITPPEHQKGDHILTQERGYEHVSWIYQREGPPQPSYGHQLPSIKELFGGHPPPAIGPVQRLQHDPIVPNWIALARENGIQHRPYGGGQAPRNPSAPGGALYHERLMYPGRVRSYEPDLSRFPEHEIKRFWRHYRHIGEPWGIAEYKEYETWFKGYYCG